MTIHPDYYQLLHVLPDAPAPVIKASYRAMMQKLRHHPDLGGDPSRAQLLNEAVDILCNPAKRARYDSEMKAAGMAAPSSAEHAGTGDSGKPPQPARADSSRAAKDSTSAGGRPNGYSTYKPPPEEPDIPEPAHPPESAVAHKRLPPRPHCLFCKAAFAVSPRSRHRYVMDELCLQCSAPTALLEQLDTSTSEELRRIYRHEHDAPVSLWAQWPMEARLQARLLDLSLAGCAIELHQAQNTGTIVLIDTDALKAVCEVRYCTPAQSDSSFTIGLAFRTLQIKARPGSMFSAVA